MAAFSQWTQLELTLAASAGHANPYTDLIAWIDFTHETGRQVRRPAFWDGGQTWRVRFAPSLPGRWSWQASSDPADAAIALQAGQIDVGPSDSANRFHRHGLLRMPPRGRNVV